MWIWVKGCRGGLAQWEAVPLASSVPGWICTCSSGRGRGRSGTGPRLRSQPQWSSLHTEKMSFERFAFKCGAVQGDLNIPGASGEEILATWEKGRAWIPQCLCGSGVITGSRQAPGKEAVTGGLQTMLCQSHVHEEGLEVEVGVWVHARGVLWLGCATRGKSHLVSSSVKPDGSSTAALEFCDVNSRAAWTSTHPLIEYSWPSPACFKENTSKWSTEVGRERVRVICLGWVRQTQSARKTPRC